MGVTAIADAVDVRERSAIENRDIPVIAGMDDVINVRYCSEP